MGNPQLVHFTGGETGPWRVLRMRAIAGPPLTDVAYVSTSETQGAWTLRGVVSHVRYVERAEGAALRERQEGLGRPAATRAALIPIKKADAWWDLAQDERRAIFEERSRHIASTLRFLPAIARRLHHARDLGEPFDFLTWFEFAPEHEALFDELLHMLRATEEWRYVTREIEIHLASADSGGAGIER
jgi:chlorite dismutase